MSTAVRDLFAVVGGSSKPSAPAWQTDTEQAYVEVSNLLLAMHWAAVEANDHLERAGRIASRLDDPAIVATDAQRGAAEARHWHHTQSAKRLINDTVKRNGRLVARKFGAMSDERLAWAVEELARAWFDSPIWPIVRVDPVLGRDPVWSVMYRAAQLGPINSDPCPF